MRHDIPLLSLAKTKAVSDLASFLKGHAALLMLKLDGLTVKLVYEDGRLAEASTRGDGEEGENVTHNIAAFRNVPLSIPYKERLVITGEGFIHKSDFERLKDRPPGATGSPTATQGTWPPAPSGAWTQRPAGSGRSASVPSMCLRAWTNSRMHGTAVMALSTRGEKDDVDDEMKDFLAYIENSTDACAQETSSPLVKAIHKRVTE